MQSVSSDNKHQPRRVPTNLSVESTRPGGNNPTTNTPSVLFVGNLSYFCEESQLHSLFDEYCYVQNVRIHRNEAKTRSLQFGFITVSSPGEAKKMESMLNNHLFMGRKLRVSFTPPEKRQGDHDNGGVQVHVSFCSFFDPQSLVLPRESLLRKVFLDHGKIVDVCVKEYRQYDDKNMQEGYAFVTMATMEEAQQLCASCSSIFFQGFTLSCSLTRASAAAASALAYQHHTIGGVAETKYQVPYTPKADMNSLPIAQNTQVYQTSPYPYYGYAAGHASSPQYGMASAAPPQPPMYMMTINRDNQQVFVPYTTANHSQYVVQQSMPMHAPTLTVPHMTTVATPGYYDQYGREKQTN